MNPFEKLDKSDIFKGKARTAKLFVTIEYVSEEGNLMCDTYCSKYLLILK